MRKQRPQVRSCSLCGKVGHNRSRCPQKATEKIIKKSNTARPAVMHFFVHHVNNEATPSPHILDLKKSQLDILKKIQTIAPANQDKSFFHFHHRLASVSSSAPVQSQPLFQKPIAPPSFTPKKNNLGARGYYSLSKKISTIISAIAQARNKLNNSIIKLAHKVIHFFTVKIPWKRLSFAISVLLIILISPFQASTYYQQTKLTVNNIGSQSTAGFTALKESTTALINGDIDTADQTISTALNRFENAINTLQNHNQLLQKIVSIVPILNTAVISRQKIILAGQEISLGNGFLIQGISASRAAASSTLTQNLSVISSHLKLALPNYQKALANLNEIKPSVLPPEYQNQFEDFKKIFTALNNDLNTLTDLSDSLQEIFGGQGFRRYLLVFQNPAELRPTGGFVGSLAIIDINNGQITNLEIPPGGPYDLQGQLSENLIPPSPLLLLRSRWEFQDANWFPDFPKSAEKMMRLYRKSRAVTVDGVIAINATVLNRILTVTGPLQDDKRNLTLAADNVLATIQQVVESSSERSTGKPKQIIADLAPQILNYFTNFDSNNILALLSNLQQALAQKEIQAYFTDEVTETKIKELGWGGDILTTTANQDYLMVINTNIQGQKSDARIKQKISHQAVVDSDGSVIDTVIITRTHTGTATENFYGANNVDYLRLYVPAGSELIEASGFTWPDENNFRTPSTKAQEDPDLLNTEEEIGIDRQTGTRITREFGKTAFGNWIITEPGQTTQVQFVYRLPFKLKAQSNLSNNWANFILANRQTALGYQLVTQRQSGCESSIESQIIFPDNYFPSWSQGQQIRLAANGAIIENQPLTQNQVWSVLAKD